MLVKIQFNRGIRATERTPRQLQHANRGVRVDGHHERRVLAHIDRQVGCRRSVAAENISCRRTVERPLPHNPATPCSDDAGIGVLDKRPETVLE